MVKIKLRGETPQQQNNNKNIKKGKPKNLQPKVNE
jgi:hypothetical protein